MVVVVDKDVEVEEGVTLNPALLTSLTYHASGVVNSRHYASKCTVPYDEIQQLQTMAEADKTKETMQTTQEGVQFGCFGSEHVGHTRINLLQPSESLISKTWVLLDNASMVDVFVNPDLVINI